MINPGDLRHRIEFLTGNRDPINWDENPKFWASFKTLKGERLFMAQQIWQKVTAEVRLRFTRIEDDLGKVHDIKAGWLVKFDDGRMYTIETVVDEDEMHEVLTLTVSEVS